MVTTEEILSIARPQVARDEGCRLHAYPDPLSHGEPYTIGYGSTGGGIGPDTVWTQEQADHDLDERLGHIYSELDKSISWWRNLDAPRAAVLVNMAYNLGVSGLLEFRTMLSRLAASNYSGAVVAMVNSKWARQLPARSVRLASQLLSGRVTGMTGK
jgi:lysozyme